MEFRISRIWLASVTMVVCSVAAGLIVAWLLRHILLVFFGAIVLAVALRSAADFVVKLLPIDPKQAVAVVCLLIALASTGLVLFLGAHVASQVSSVVEAIPRVSENIEDRFGINVRQVFQDTANVGWIGGALGYVPSVFSIVSAMILVVVAAIFLALDPAGHREGMLQLVPFQHRDKLRKVLNDAGRALQLWLIGQVIAMAIIGTLTATVLYLFGVPSALALGLITGLLEFVPYAGAILAYVPLGLAALSQDMTTFWWVLAFYVLIQQIEGNVLQPLIQKRTGELPPVLALFAIELLVCFSVRWGWLWACLLAWCCWWPSENSISAVQSAKMSVCRERPDW